MVAIHQHLERAGFLVFQDQRENAAADLEGLGVETFTYEPGRLAERASRLLVLGNDWGPWERQLIVEARQLGVPTVVIQEGCLDFGDPNLRRMCQADFAFVQGPETLRYLERENTVITGNPKYDKLLELPFDPELPIMVNCNFTYGVYEEVREAWMNGVTAACLELEHPFFVSQHPRDKYEFPSDYPVIRSRAAVVRDHLAQSSVLVTRFSTVIYEALMMGRRAVYFNPHGEPFPTFQNDATGTVPVAKSRDELRACLYEALNTRIDASARRNFLLAHCATLEKDAGRRCARAIEKIIQD